MGKTPENQFEASERAQPLLQQLEDAKTNFRDQIISLVQSRQPFGNVGKNDLSNLLAINFLTMNPSMMDDAKKWAEKISIEYKTKNPQLAAVMEGFWKLLDQPQTLEKHGNTIRDKVFHPDKEEVNEYLLLIAAYVDAHLDQYIDFIKAIDAQERLMEKFNSPGGFLNVTSDEFDKSVDNVMKFKEIPSGLTLPVSAIVTQQYMEEDKTEWSKFSEKWLESILQTLIRYSKIEEKLGDESVPPKK